MYYNIHKGFTIEIFSKSQTKEVFKVILKIYNKGFFKRVNYLF